MKKSRYLVIAFLFLIALFETIFVGCGGGDSNSFEDPDIQPIGYAPLSVEASPRGGFVLNAQNLGISVNASNDTITQGSAVVLSAREAKTNESKEFGNSCTKIYKLEASVQDSSSLKTTKVTKLNKPLSIEIVESFPEGITEFYLGRRESPDANWQYSKLDGSGRYFSNSNVNTFSSVRMATGATVNYYFNINTATLGDEMAVFGGLPDGAGAIPTVNSVSKMDFTTDLPYLDLKLADDNSGDIVYNTDLVVKTGIEASRVGTLFNGAKAMSLITFITSSDKPIESLQVDGNTTAFATEKVEPNGGGDYLHSIFFQDYPHPAVRGRLATYSFTIKLRNVSLEEFPDSYTMKTVLVDANGIAYSSEATLTRDYAISYLKASLPNMKSGKVPVGSKLEMDYLAHDIATLTVFYTTASQSTPTPLIMDGSITKDPATHKLIFSPDLPWPPSTIITASATASCCEAHEIYGNRTTQFKFETDATPGGDVPIGDDTYTEATATLQLPATTDNIVPPPTQITIHFSEELAWDDAFFEKIKITSNVHPVTIENPVYTAGAQTLSFQPKEDLRYNASYTIHIDQINDKNNLHIVLPTTLAFGTGDGPHPQASVIASTTGQITPTLHTTQPIFTIDFGSDLCKSDYINQNLIDFAFSTIKVYKIEDNHKTIVPIKNLNKEWSELYDKITLSFKVSLDPESEYQITMDEGVVNYQNLPIEPFAPYTFNTAGKITAELFKPDPNIDVPIDTNIELIFSGPIDWIATYSKSINLFCGKEEIPTINPVYDPATQKFSMNPKTPLLYNASYAVLIAPGLFNQSTLQEIASDAFYFSTADGVHFDSQIKLAEKSKHGADNISHLTSTIEIDFGSRVLNYFAAQSAVKIYKDGIDVTNNVEIGYDPATAWSNQYQKVSIPYFLEPNTTYTVKLDEKVRAFNGSYINPSEFTFTTCDNISILSISPANNSTGIATNSPIIFTFSEDIAWSGSEEDKLKFSFYRGNTNVRATLASFDYATATKELTITPKSLFYNASYTIHLYDPLHNAITGQIIATGSSYFETEDSTHAQAEVAFAPESLIAGQAILTPSLIVDLKKEIVPLSDAEKAFKFYKNGTERVEGYTFIWSSDRTKVTLKFVTPLEQETNYTLKMESAPKDYEGIPVDQFADFDFTTIKNLSAELTTPATTTDVAIDTKLVLTFSHPITWNEAAKSNLSLRYLGQEVPIKTYNYSEADNTLTFIPKANFLHNGTYTLMIRGPIINEATGQKIATGSFTFVTADGTHDKAEATIALDSIVNGQVVLNPVIHVDLKKDVAKADEVNVKTAIKLFKNGVNITETNCTTVWETEHNKLKLALKNLDPLSNYRLTMDEGIKNIEGIFIDPFDNLEFTTQDIIHITMVSPAAATNVSIDTAIILEFSEAVDWVQNDENRYKLKIKDLEREIQSFTYNTDSHQLTIVPAERLLYGTTYTIEARKGTMNNATKQTTASQTFTFTTEPGTNTDAILMVSESDKVNELKTDEDQTLGVKDILIVTPTFIVDFGTEVKITSAAADAIRLCYENGNIATHTLNKIWVDGGKRQLQITLPYPELLSPTTIYKLCMDDDVRSFDGSIINKFQDYKFKTTPNGTGSKTKPYLIYAPIQLDNIRKNMKPWYRLARDIDISPANYKSVNNSLDQGWTPIGNKTDRFQGGLDGNNFVITGLYINNSTLDSAGLFGQTASATLQNITLEEGSVIGEDSVGALVGYANTTTIEFCWNKSVKVSGRSHAGGLAGECYSSKITKCRNSADISCSGTTEKDTNNEVIGSRAGGIVGWNNYQSVITSCYNQGSVTGAFGKVGGIAGYNTARLSNSSNIGKIKGQENVGGIAGHNAMPGKISFCIAVGNISVTNFAGINIGAITGINTYGSNLLNNIFTNNTLLNNKECEEDSEAVYNYSEYETPNNCNHFFGSLTTLKRAMGDAGYWLNGEIWSNSLWEMRDDGIPVPLGLPE